MYNEEYRGIPEEFTPLSIKQYIVMHIVCMIPIVGLIYILKLAIMEENRNKKNFALSYLVVIAIALIAFLIFKEPLLSLIKSSY